MKYNKKTDGFNCRNCNKFWHGDKILEFSDMEYAYFFLDKGCPKCVKIPKKQIQKNILNYG